jgi:predicted Zn-dependent protease
VYINPQSDPNDPGLPECLALTTTHELGHALGIWRHSSAATDLMYFDPGVDAPSDRDLATAEVIYHVPANVEAVGP